MTCAYCKSDKFPTRSTGIVVMCIDVTGCIQRKRLATYASPPAPEEPKPPDKPRDN